MKKFAGPFWKSKNCLYFNKTFHNIFAEIISFRHNSVPEILERHATGWGEEAVPEKQVVILQQPVHLKLRAPHQVPDLREERGNNQSIIGETGNHSSAAGSSQTPGSAPGPRSGVREGE